MLDLSYDFTLKEDGDPFPPGIGFGVLKQTGGLFSEEVESSPSTYYLHFKDVGDITSTALFNYTESGSTEYHGLVCSPGALDGTNSDQSVLFRNPLSFFNSNDDGFVSEIILGCRGKSMAEWVGGRLFSSWTPGGGWNPAMSLSAVIMSPAAGLAVVDTEVLENEYLDLNEFLVRIKDSAVYMRINGGDIFEVPVSFKGETKSILWIKVYRVISGVVTPVAILETYSGAALQSGITVPVQEVPTQQFPIPLNGNHFYQVPVQQLLDEGKLKSRGPHCWEFTEETLVESEDRMQFKASAGAVIVEYNHILPEVPFRWCKVQYV